MIGWFLFACTGTESGDDTSAPGVIFGQVLGMTSALDARRVAVIEDQAYVCAGQEGLYRFDVSDPVSPTYIETFFLGGDCQDMLQLAGTIFAATGSGGFQVIQPEPLLVAGVHVPDGGYEVRSLGVDTTYDFAYLAEWNGTSARVERVNFQIPDVPKVEASVAAGSAEPMALLENNEVVYLLGADGALGIYGIWLDALGGRDPQFVGAGDADLAWDDDILTMVVGDSGLVSARVTDPSYPADVFTWDGNGHAVHAVTTAADDRLYVALEGAIAVFDMADPYAPALVHGELILVSHLQRPVDITVADGVAYIVDRADQSLTLVNVDED